MIWEELKMGRPDRVISGVSYNYYVTEVTEPERPFYGNRNYTCPDERFQWWWLSGKRWVEYPCTPLSKQVFRTRRNFWGRAASWPATQALRAQIGGNDDIGTLLRITNLYALIGTNGSENFYSALNGDLPDIPVIKSSICGCRVVGCMTAGNKHGLIVPETIYDTELQQIKEELPDSVEVKKLEERLSALGNVVVCNDKVALIHPELDKESEEIIEDTLQVEVFRHSIADNPLVGSCCVLNNKGGLVHVDISNSALENLASLLQLPLVAGTVNSGNKIIASGIAANDLIAYAGMKTTTKEFISIEAAFQFERRYTSNLRIYLSGKKDVY